MENGVGPPGTHATSGCGVDTAAVVISASSPTSRREDTKKVTARTGSRQLLPPKEQEVADKLNHTEKERARAENPVRGTSITEIVDVAIAARAATAS